MIKKSSPILILIMFWLISILFLTSCEINNAPSISTSPTITNIPSQISTPTKEVKAASQTPLPRYQLTYVASCDEEYDCMYSIDVHGLNNEHPIFDPPQILFVLQNTGEPPEWPILFNSWSSDGKRILIGATGINGRGDVFLGDSSGVKWINLTNSPEYEGTFHWSNDGKSVFYTGKLNEPNSRYKLYSISLDGQNNEQLLSKLDPSIGISEFSISPNGKRVVFSSSVGLFLQLFIADLDGSNLLQLTNQEEDHYEPQFTPDGQWIIYRRDPKTTELISYICLIKPDGSEENIIPADILGWKTSFAWSPIGNWISFTVRDSRGFHPIFIIRKDGTGLTQVSPTNIDADFPAWRMISP